jgi:hypothetical protein
VTVSNFDQIESLGCDIFIVSIFVMTVKGRRRPHHGAKTMRKPALYMSGRAGEGILFVSLP